MSVHRDRARAAAAVLALALAGCGPPADDPHSRLTEHREPGGAYVVRYLAPPWELASTEGSAATLRIISTTEAFTGVAETGVPDKYLLQVAVVGGAAEALARADARAAASRSEEVVVDVREVSTRSGDAGFELITRTTVVDGRPEMRSRRYVYLARAGGGAVRLFFEANPSLGSREIDEMVRSVDVDPE